MTRITIANKKIAELSEKLEDIANENMENYMGEAKCTEHGIVDGCKPN
jgi:hypothetical protein